MYASDKDRVSAIIFPAILTGWLKAAQRMAAEKGVDDAFHEAMVLLVEAESLPLSGLDARASLKVARRVDRLIDATIGDYQGDNMAKVYLAIAYAMVDLTQQGRMVIADGSPLARAFDMLTPAITGHADIVLGVDKSAAKASRKIVATLIKEGYF